MIGRRSFFAGLLGTGVPVILPAIATTTVVAPRAISYEQPACSRCGRMLMIPYRRDGETDEQRLQCLTTPQPVTCDCGHHMQATFARYI